MMMVVFIGADDWRQARAATRERRESAHIKLRPTIVDGLLKGCILT